MMFAPPTLYVVGALRDQYICFLKDTVGSSRHVCRTTATLHRVRPKPLQASSADGARSIFNWRKRKSLTVGTERCVEAACGVVSCGVVLCAVGYGFPSTMRRFNDENPEKSAVEFPHHDDERKMLEIVAPSANPPQLTLNRFNLYCRAVPPHNMQG